MSNKIELSESLLQTLSMFSKHTNEESPAAVAVEATISSVEDEALGLYNVAYLGNTFIAHSVMPNIVYKENDSVYILVPENDFTKDKLIIGYTSPLDNDVLDDSKFQGELFYDVSDNLFTTDLGTIQMSSYEEEDSGYKNMINSNFASLFGQIMNEYKDQYNNFSFYCKIKTEMEQSQQSVGDYGIELRIPVLKKKPYDDEHYQYEEAWESYILSTDNISGDPYRLNTWSDQEIRFSFDENTIYDDGSFSTIKRVPQIRWYDTGFPTTTDPELMGRIDIEIKDVGLKAIDILNEEAATGYHLTLLASQGPYFSKFFDSKKTITPVLKYNGRNVKLEGRGDDVEIYWFRENVEVKPDHLLYTTYGGWGWACINEKTNVVQNDDGTQTVNYNTAMSSIEMDVNDVKASARIKCVIVYKKHVVEKTLYLKNLDGSCEIKLYTPNNKNLFINNVGNVEMYLDVYIQGITNDSKYTKSVVYSWMRQDKNNQRISDLDDFYEVVSSNEMVQMNGKYWYRTVVRFPVSSIDEMNTVYATVKYVQNDVSEILGTEHIQVLTSDDIGFRLTIEHDDILYKYDVDGHSPMGVAYEGPSTSRVQTIEPLTYILRKDDGEELTGTEYAAVNYKWTIPKKSMFTIDSNLSGYKTDDDYIYIEGVDNVEHTMNLPYTIKDRYYPNNIHEQIILEVKFNGQTFTQRANIAFTKEGQTGTNGTALAATLMCQGYHYGQLDKNGIAQNLKFLYDVNGNGTLYFWDWINKNRAVWNTSNRQKFTIKPVVYLDGKILDSSNYTCEMSLIDYDHGLSETETNKCFDVRAGVRSGEWELYLTKNPTAADLNSNSSTFYCNIVQAKITVRNQGSVAHENEILYCYYPLDFSITDFTSGIMPSIDSGFTEVMYEQDGTNPQYDETNPFQIRDCNSTIDDLSQFFTMNWSSSKFWSPSMDRFTFKSQGGSRELKGYEVWATPNNKYDDGTVANYIKNILTLQSGGQQIVSNMKNQNTQLTQDLDKIITEATTNRQALNNFANNYNQQYYLEKIEALKTFYSYRTKCYTALDDIVEQIDAFKQFIEIQELTPYGINFTTIDNVIAAARTGLDSLSSTNDIKKLSSAIISTNGLQDRYVNEYGYSTANVMMNYINAINDRLSTYDKNQYIWMVREADKKITNYNKTALQLGSEIITSLKNGFNYITDSCYSDFVQMRKSAYNYVVKFSTVNTSYAGIKSLFQTLYNDYLSTVFVLRDNVLMINSQTETKLKNIDDEAQKNKQEAQDIIESCNNIVNQTGKTIVCYKPILLYYNRYSKSNINGWDGNKVEIGEDGDGRRGYLLAPQVGAGYKNDDNTFSGMVIGLRNVTGDESNPNKDPEEIDTQPGLFGYHKGVQTVWMDSYSGTTVLGKVGGNGQFVIDTRGSVMSDDGQHSDKPTGKNGRMLLYSTNYWEPSTLDSRTGLPKLTSYTGRNSWENELKPDRGAKTFERGEGMLLDMSAPRIKFGSNRFFLTYEGVMFVGGQNSDDKGGSAGGWYIFSDRLQSANYKGLKNSSGEGICIKSSSFYSSSTNADDLANAASEDKGIPCSKAEDKEANLDSIPYIHFGNSKAQIMSGQHLYLSSREEGFHLSHEGLSIGSRVEIDSKGIFQMGNLKSESGKRWILSAPENGDDAFFAYNRGNKDNVDLSFDSLKNDSILLTTDGLLISKLFRVYSNKEDSDRNSQSGGRLEIGNLGNSSGRYWTIAGDAKDSYISYKKTGLDVASDSAEGVFLSTKGLRLGNRFLLQADSEDTEKGQFIRLGNLKSSSEKYWEISVNNDESYIKYGKYATIDKIDLSGENDKVESRKNSILISTKGIRIGDGFQVDADGNALYVGRLTNERHWTISQSNDTGNSYIGWKFKSIKDAGRSGCYFATNGLRLGNRFMVDIDGAYKDKTGVDSAILLGNLEDLGTAAKDGGKYWTIGADGSESYISFGGYTSFEAAQNAQQDRKNVVFISTKGLAIGKEFNVDNTGKMMAASGTIANWQITKNYIFAKSPHGDTFNDSGKIYNQGIILRSDGDIAGGYVSEDGIVYQRPTLPDGNKNKYWEIEADGSAQFDGVKIGGGSNSFTTGYQPSNDPSQAKVNITEEGNATFTDIHISGTSSIMLGTTYNQGNQTFNQFTLTEEGHCIANNITITSFSTQGGAGGSSIALPILNYNVQSNEIDGTERWYTLNQYVFGAIDKETKQMKTDISNLSTSISNLADSIRDINNAGYATRSWVEAQDYAKSGHTHNYASSSHTHEISVTDSHLFKFVSGTTEASISGSLVRNAETSAPR